VTVIETGDRRALLINGKTDATIGSGEDMAQQVLWPGAAPPRAWRQARLLVGYEARHDARGPHHTIEKALTIELEGAVIEAAPLFESAADRPLRDPAAVSWSRTRGTYLRSTKEDFDVIISEPSNPWIAGWGISSRRSSTRRRVGASARVGSSASGSRPTRCRGHAFDRVPHGGTVFSGRGHLFYVEPPAISSSSRCRPGAHLNVVPMTLP